MGYPYGVKGFKVLNLATRKIFVSRDVLFHEIVFPFISSTYSSSPHSTITFPHIFPSLDISNDSLPYVSHLVDPITTFILDSPSHFDPTPALSNSDLPPFPLLHTTSDLPISDLPKSVPTSTPSDVPLPSAHADPVAIPFPNFVPSLRKSTRITKAPTYLKDYKCSTVVQDQFVHSNPTFKTGSNSSISSTKYPLSQYLDSSSLSPS